MVDKIVSNSCFYQQTIISFCLNAVNPPPPGPQRRIIVVCSKWKTWGSKNNIEFGGTGWGYTGGGDRYVHYVKWGRFCRSVSTLLSRIVASIKDSSYGSITDWMAHQLSIYLPATSSSSPYKKEDSRTFLHTFWAIFSLETLFAGALVWSSASSVIWTVVYQVTGNCVQ